MPSKNNWLYRWTIWPYLLMASGSAGLMTWLQNYDGFTDPDSFYHARLVIMTAQHGLAYAFPWLQATGLAQHFTDQNVLYHLLLIPLTWWFNPIIALKISAVVLAVLLGLVLLRIAQRYQLHPWYSTIALILLFTLNPFLMRLNLIKAGPLAIILALSVTVLLINKQYRWAAVLTLAYTYIHAGFILTVVLGGCIWIADTMMQSWQKQRLVFSDPRVIWVPLLTCIIGLVCNPYFPNNITFWWQQFVQIGVINYGAVLQVGAEWYPYPINDLVGSSSLLFVGLLLAIVVLIWQRHRQTLTTFSFAIITLLLLLITLRSRRYVEYFIPFAWLWIMLVLVPYLQSGLWREQLQKIQRQFGRWSYAIIVYLTITLTIGMVQGVRITYHNLRAHSFSTTLYQAADQYLIQHTPEHSTIFHTAWDQFPMMWYHNTHNNFLVGLDPTFMYLYNKQQYLLWQDISTGKIKTGLAQLIVHNFNAHYVMMKQNDPASQLFLAYLGRDPQAQLVYQDTTARIYYLNVQP